LLRKLTLAALLIVAICGGTLAYLFVYDPHQLPFEIYLATAERVEQAQELVERVVPPCTLASAKLIDIPPPPTIPNYAQEAKSIVVATEFSKEYSAVPIVGAAWKHIDVMAGQIDMPSNSETGIVNLSIIAGATGDVLEAVPRSGPKAHFAEAVAIAKHWKFKPFFRDGKPAIVRIDDLQVPIGQPAWRVRARKPFPVIKNWDSLRITLEQSNGGWGGKSYLIQIGGDGTVTFKGYSEVAVRGTHCARIGRDAVTTLFDQFRRVDFLSLHPYSGSVLFDAAITRIAIEFDDHSGRLNATAGPAEFEWLDHLIRRTTAAERWIDGNDLTLETLKAEGWNFRATNPTNRSLVDGILWNGNLIALNDALAAGAPIVTEWNDNPARYLAGYPWEPALTVAARNPDPSFLHAILRSPARWDQKALDTALDRRAQHGDLDTMNELIAKGAKPSGDTLAAAVGSGVPAVVARVLALSPNAKLDRDLLSTAIAPVDSWSWRELRSAAEQRDEVLRLLIAAGADPKTHNVHGETLLVALADASVAKVLLAAGVDVNTRTNSNSTALMTAASPEVVAILLKAGADPLVKTKNGRTALDISADLGNLAATRALLAANLAWDAPTLGRTFVLAAERRDLTLAKQLLLRGADANVVASRKLTPLMAAAMHADAELVELLLKKKADVNAKDDDGATALHHAVAPPRDDLADGEAADRRRTVELLLDNGASINAKDNLARTPLHFASDIPILELLLARGADIHARTDLGRTPLGGPDPAAIRLLAKHGADVSARDNQGSTPLMLVASQYHDRYALAATEALLSAGADPTLKNKKGETALDIAKAWQNDELVTLLENLPKRAQ
jgi:ankyrin repeat protein